MKRKLHISVNPKATIGPNLCKGNKKTKKYNIAYQEKKYLRNFASEFTTRIARTLLIRQMNRGKFAYAMPWRTMEERN